MKSQPILGYFQRSGTPETATMGKTMYLRGLLLAVLLTNAVAFAPLSVKRWARLGSTVNSVRAGQVKGISIPTPDTEHSSKLSNIICNHLNIGGDGVSQSNLLMFTKWDEAGTDVSAPLLDDSKLSYAGFGTEVVGAAELIKVLVSEGCTVTMPMDDYQYGATIIPEEDYMKTTPARYATLVDRNGYRMELVEAPPANTGTVAAGRISRLILYVEDLEESIEFYTKVLGMTLYRKRSNVNNTPKDASFIAHVGYGDEKEGVCLELKYRYATDKITHRPRPCTLYVEVPDLDVVRQSAGSMNILKGDWSKQDDGVRLTDPSGYEVAVQGAQLLPYR